MIEKVRDNLYIRTSHVQQMQSVILLQADKICLFDPAYFADEISEIQAFTSAHEHGREKKYILTHSDFDHIAGVHYFSEYSVFVASTWDEENEVRAIDQIELFDSQFYVDRPWTGKMARVPIHQQLGGGDHLGDLSFLHAKGHTNDGLVTLVDSIAIVGDYLSALEFPFIYTSFSDYCETMESLREAFTKREISLVVTQHGPYAEGKAEIAERFSLANDYLEQLNEVVTEGIQSGRDVEEVIESAESRINFDSKPIAPGLMNAHRNNVRVTWRERRND